MNNCQEQILVSHLKHVLDQIVAEWVLNKHLNVVCNSLSEPSLQVKLIPFKASLKNAAPKFVRRDAEAVSLDNLENWVEGVSRE